MTFPPGFSHLPYLPEPSRVPRLTIVVDFSDPFETYYDHTATMTSPREGSFQEFLMCMQQDDLVQMALHAIEITISRSTYTTGISYSDIGNLDVHPEARRSLYAGQLGESFNRIYRPQISGTMQYHLDSMEGALTDAIQSKAGEHSRQGVNEQDDVILWRTLYACALITAKTIAEAGRMKGISENALMSYHFADLRSYGEGTNAYVLTLEGP